MVTIKMLAVLTVTAGLLFGAREAYAQSGAVVRQPAAKENKMTFDIPGPMKVEHDDPGKQSHFYETAEEGFGIYDIWKADFVSIGKMRGVGWAICFQDPKRGRLTNQWVTLHEMGNIAGFDPVLVMDVSEHAFLLDYKPAERPKYIEAFFANIDWNAVEERLKVDVNLT